MVQEVLCRSFRMKKKKGVICLDVPDCYSGNSEVKFCAKLSGRYRTFQHIHIRNVGYRDSNSAGSYGILVFSGFLPGKRFILYGKDVEE